MYRQVSPWWCRCCHNSHIPGKYYRVHQSPGRELWGRQRAADVWGSTGQRHGGDICLWQPSSRYKTIHWKTASPRAMRLLHPVLFFSSLKGRGVRWWRALSDRTGPFCTTALSTPELMQRRWVLKWVVMLVTSDVIMQALKRSKIKTKTRPLTYILTHLIYSYYWIIC